MGGGSSRLDDVMDEFSSEYSLPSSQVRVLRKSLKLSGAAISNALEQGMLSRIRLIEGGNQDKSIGFFDKDEGCLYLPGGAFSDPSAMASILKVQSRVIEFSREGYFDRDGSQVEVTGEMVKNLQETINESPQLTAMIKKAMITPDAGGQSGRMQLEGFKILKGGMAAGGTFDPISNVMNIPSAELRSPSGGPFNGADLTFVLGHEVQHSFNNHDKRISVQTFLRDISSEARIASPAHDYTGTISAYIEAGREDEAKAEIAGWNALLSRLQAANPSFGLEEMASLSVSRVDDFLDRDFVDGKMVYSIKDGLLFNADGSLDQSPQNIQSMARNYFDRPVREYAAGNVRPMAIGAIGTSDYTNYYGAFAINEIVRVHNSAPDFDGRRPELTINMSALGLHEDLLEKEGLDLGKDRALQQYFDSSQLPSAPRRFDHTIDGPYTHQHVPVAPGLAERSHPDHALYRDVQRMLPPETSKDRLAQITLSAKMAGIGPGGLREFQADEATLHIIGRTPGMSASVDLSAPPPPAEQAEARLHEINAQQVQQLQSQQLSQGYPRPMM